MSDALPESALSFACQRVEDFALVNRAREGTAKGEAVKVWLAHLGLDEPRFRQLVMWLDGFLDPGWGGDVLIGFAVGLLVNQYNNGDA